MWEMNFFPPFHARVACKLGGSCVNSVRALWHMKIADFHAPQRALGRLVRLKNRRLLFCFFSPFYPINRDPSIPKCIYVPSFLPPESCSCVSEWFSAF